MPADLRDFGLSPRQVALVQNALRPGEQVRWVGQPMAFRSIDWGKCIGSLLFTGVLGGLGGFVFYHLVTGEPEARGFVLLFAYGLSLLFVLLFVAALLTPFVRLWLLRHTFYVITNQRALIAGVGEESWPLCRRMVASNFQRKDGSGNLVFALRWEDGPKGMGRTVEHGFMNLRDVRMVEEILEKAIAERKKV